jgi:copper homeostasis protein
MIFKRIASPSTTLQAKALSCAMVKKFLLEAVVDSLESALAAQAAGADRIELCSALELGGLTPGPGLQRQVCQVLNIPVHVLIRTRGGNFECSADEFKTLLEEAAAARRMGAAGIVVGILTSEGRIDVARMQHLVEAAAPLSVTFHRAFDRCLDHDQALQDLLATGCHRLLSSGFGPNASEGKEALKWLREKAEGQVVIMPGGGVSVDNIVDIAQTTHAVEFHFSAIEKTADGGWKPIPEKVAAMRAAITTYFESKN